MAASMDVSYHASYGKRLRVTLEKVTGASGTDWLEITVRDHNDEIVGEITAYRADLIEITEDVVEAAE